MYLYRATKDPYFLEVGRDMLHSIESSARTPCGYATVSTNMKIVIVFLKALSLLRSGFLHCSHFVVAQCFILGKNCCVTTQKLRLPVVLKMYRLLPGR